MRGNYLDSMQIRTIQWHQTINNPCCLQTNPVAIINGISVANARRNSSEHFVETRVANSVTGLALSTLNSFVSKSGKLEFAGKRARN